MAKKKMPESVPDEQADWIVSYADLMTLLACFFMLMMAFANYDTPGAQQKAKVIAETFTKTGGTSELEMEKLSNEIAKHPDFQDRLKVTLRDGELIIVFSGSAVFPEGSYLLDSKTTEILDSLIEIIKMRDTEYRLLVEGHADKNESLIAGNMNHWSLSAARAASVAARFEYFGFKSEYMAAVAKGDKEPIAEYRQQAAKGVPPREISKLNRRTVIRVLEPIGKQQGSIRVGVLFKDAEGAPDAADSNLFKESE